MLEAVEGRLCLLEVLEVTEVIRCVLFCAGGCEGRLGLLEVSEVLGLIRGVLLDMLEAVSVLMEVPEVPEVMRLRATLYARGCGGCALFAGRAGRARGDTLCTTLYAGGHGRVGSVCWKCWR